MKFEMGDGTKITVAIKLTVIYVRLISKGLAMYTREESAT